MSTEVGGYPFTLLRATDHNPDIHIGNIGFRVPGVAELSGPRWSERLNNPQVVVVLSRQRDMVGSPSLPVYTVEPADLNLPVRYAKRVAGSKEPSAVIMDFGSGAKRMSHAM